MLECAADLLPLLRAGRSAAVVTVTRIARSAPRGVGTSMVVTADARVLGSLSSGCVEGDAVLLALDALATGRARRATFGVATSPRAAAPLAGPGLACGGSIEVLAYRVTPEDGALVAALEDVVADRPAAVALVRSGTDAGTVVALATTDRRVTAPDACNGDDDGALLVLRHVPRPHLILLGASEHAVALCRVAAAAGFAVSVCDSSGLMATRERFPDAVDVVVGDPAEHLAALPADAVDERTAICVLTHDLRVDVPALSTALGLPAGFVGAMGARSTVVRRARLLRAAGVDEPTLARLRSPIGLDLGGTGELETALSILAEIVAVRHGATGRPLSSLAGRLHGRTPRPVPGPLPLRPASTTTNGAVA